MFSSLIFKRKVILNISAIRCKHKENHWSMKDKKKTASKKALEHFDNFYDKVFGKNWYIIRKALLGKSKYIAVVNNYSDSEEICQTLENRGAMNIRRIFQTENELIKESRAKNKRQDMLEKVWKQADEKVEVEEVKPKEFSLEASLKDAKIDVDRFIDGRTNTTGVLHEFMPITKIKGREDFIPESEHYRYYEKGKGFPVNEEKEYDLNFSENLNAYCYEEESFTEFPHPKRGSTGVFNYYLMDGGSLLPVLGLDLQPGNSVLDMCCAPGGKSFLALQTLYPDYLVCNDISISRTNRIQSILNQYFYDVEEKWMKSGKIKITCSDGRSMEQDLLFDRVLVDVPCTTDRHSLNEDDNNIFRVDRIKERLKIPELQSELLFNALKLVKIGGIVVYSTCSLSPIQNDGVVHMTLKRLWEETRIETVVKDLNPALQQTKSVYKLASPKLVRFGNLVLPHSYQNYGPTYFCKIQRVS